MKELKFQSYLAPIVEMQFVVAERGYIGSVNQLPEYKEDDDTIIIG
jgi:hypothetical protein